MIYHVTTKKDWQQALQDGSYEAASLRDEGFMHCSEAAQVNGVLERYYKGKSDLILLHIVENKVTSPVQYDLSPSVNEEFPHIYGPLNIDAVEKTEEI